MLDALLISLKCLLGIFIVIAIIFVVVLILNQVTKPHKKNGDQDLK